MSFAKIEIAVRNRTSAFFSDVEEAVGGFRSKQQELAAKCFSCNYWKYREGRISYAQLKKWAKYYGYEMGKD